MKPSTPETNDLTPSGNCLKPLLANRLLKFRAWNPDLKSPFMAVQGEPDLETLYSFMFHFSDNGIIMQFTGLKDCKGKEIYEGDIVKPYSIDKTKNLSIIVYEFNQFRIKGAFLYWNWDLQQIEVVGNVFENPELLQTT